MCSEEVFGDWYSDCKHFIGHYPGASFDCMNQNCRLSIKHTHTAEHCPCPKLGPEDVNQIRRIRNTFRVSKSCPHEMCVERRAAEEFDRVGRKPNNEAQY